MHAVIWGCNPFLVWEGMRAHACAPNIWKWVTSSLQELHFVVHCMVLYVVTVYQPMNIDIEKSLSHTSPHCLCRGFWSSSWIDSMQVLLSLWDAKKNHVFFHRKYTKGYREKSSTNVSTYLTLLMDEWEKGLIRSLWMISKGEDSLQAFPFSNFSWGCFITTNHWQNPLEKWMLGKPMNIPYF